METLDHTAHIVWNAIQLGNLNVLPEFERDRLMALRDNYGLKGRVAVCDATPMPSNEHPVSTTMSSSGSGKKEISEQYVREITEKVLAKLKSN